MYHQACEFISFLPVAIFLLASLFASYVMFWRMIARIRGHRIRQLAKSEVGATYLLPLALMVPFFVLFVAMTIELALLLHVKIGVQVATYAAGRAAVVWLPAEAENEQEAPDYVSPEIRKEQVHLAATRAMWAFASGAPSHASGSASGSLSDEWMDAQIAAFKSYSGRSFPTDYMKRKMQYAYKASSLEIKPSVDAERPNNVTVKLTYEAPFHTPGVGRLFGQRSSHGDYWVMKVETEIEIDQEVPMSVGHSLGIRYYQ